MEKTLTSQLRDFQIALAHVVFGLLNLCHAKFATISLAAHGGECQREV